MSDEHEERLELPRLSGEQPQQTTSPGPGIYHGVSFEDYLAWPYISNTLLGHTLKSLAHLRDALEQPRDPTPYQQTGTLAHAVLLEPEQVEEKFVVMPAFERDIRKEDGSRYANVKATKAYKQAVAEFESEAFNRGQSVITQEQLDQMLAMCRAVRSNPRAMEYLVGTEGRHELSMVWDDPETGLRCKGRMDRHTHHPRRIVDIKTTDDAGRFPLNMAKLGYHRQGAFYRWGMEQLTGVAPEFCIVVIETSRPWCVRAAPLGEASLETGQRQFRRALDAISRAKVTGDWPGYPDPDVWELPGWALEDERSEPLTLNVGGQSVKV